MASDGVGAGERSEEAHKLLEDGNGVLAEQLEGFHSGEDVEELFEELDTNHDGRISEDEFLELDHNHDGQVDAADFERNPSNFVDVKKLRAHLTFEDEKTGACLNACWFMFFSLIYIMVLNEQYQTTNAFEISQGMRDFVDGVEGSSGISYQAVRDRYDVVEWVETGLVPAVHNDRDRPAFNTLIGGVELSWCNKTSSNGDECDRIKTLVWTETGGNTSTLEEASPEDLLPHAVEVKAAFECTGHELFALVSLYIEFTKGGQVKRDVEVSVMDLAGPRKGWTNDESLFSGLNALYALLVFYVATEAYTEIRDVYRAWKWMGSPIFYFASFWNYCDVMSVVTYCFCISVWIRLTHLASTLDLGFIKNQEIKDASVVMALYNRFTIINLFVLLLQFFKYFRYQPRLAMVNKTFNHAADGLVHFMIVFVVVLFVFSIQAKVIYGREMAGFADWGVSLNSLFQTLLGEFDEDLLVLGGVDGVAFFYVYMIIVFYVLTNFFLAIVMGAYKKAEDDTRKSNSIFEDASQWLSESMRYIRGCGEKIIPEAAMTAMTPTWLTALSEKDEDSVSVGTTMRDWKQEVYTKGSKDRHGNHSYIINTNRVNDLGITAALNHFESEHRLLISRKRHEAEARSKKNGRQMPPLPAHGRILRRPALVSNRRFHQVMMGLKRRSDERNSLLDHFQKGVHLVEDGLKLLRVREDGSSGAQYSDPNDDTVAATSIGATTGRPAHGDVSTSLSHKMKKAGKKAAMAGTTLAKSKRSSKLKQVREIRDVEVGRLIYHKHRKFGTVNTVDVVDKRISVLFEGETSPHNYDQTSLHQRKLTIVPFMPDGKTFNRDAVLAPKLNRELMKSRKQYEYDTGDLEGLLAWYHDEVAKDSADTLDDDDNEVDIAVKNTNDTVKKMMRHTNETVKRLGKVEEALVAQEVMLTRLLQLCGSQEGQAQQQGEKGGKVDATKARLEKRAEVRRQKLDDDLQLIDGFMREDADIPATAATAGLPPLPTAGNPLRSRSKSPISTSAGQAISEQ